MTAYMALPRVLEVECSKFELVIRGVTSNKSAKYCSAQRRW